MAALSSRYTYEGTEVTETSITRVGGAADPTGAAQSRKITTTANSQWLRPFQAEPYAVWNPTAGADVDVTVYGTINAGALPNNDDIWMDVEYLTLSGAAPLGKIVNTTKANVLAANAAVASDGSSWNGTTASGAPLDAVASVTGAWSLGRNMKTSFGAGTRYTKIGTAITALKDQSGSSRDFTDNGAVARRPVEATAFPANVLCADFAGDALMIMTTNLALSNFITAGSGAVVVSVIVDAVTSNTTPTYNNDAIIADQSQYIGLFARNLSGVTFYAYDWDGAEKAPSTTGSVGTAYVLMWRHNGGNQYISINGGAEVLVACGNTSALTGLLTLGGGAGGSTCNCKIAEVFTTSDGSQTAALAAAISSMGSYIGVSIPSAWTPFKLTTTLSSPQPGLAGYIHARVRAAKPSTTFYIDPTPILTPAGGGTTNAATAYTSSRYAYEGTETTEISITRVGGAADPTGQKQSRKIITTANSQWLRPFKAEPYAQWNNTIGSNVTVTVCGTVNAGALPNNDDIWMDVEYLTLSGAAPLGKIVNTTKANLLAANAAVASDGSSWSVPAFTSWNPSDLSQVTLSNNNLTAAATGAVNCGARGIAGFSTGKYYLEYTMTTWGVNIIVGLALSTPVFNTGIGVACVAKGGGVAISGTGQGSIGARANGDVIGIAVDISAGLIWFRAAPSGNWNGSGTANPATGVGGISISTMSGMLFPYFGSARVSDGDVLTANFGASSFIGAAPSGFAGWATTWSPFKLTTTLNAPSPGVAGYIHTRIRAAKPSTTFYIDPQIVLGVPPPTNNKAIDGTAGGQFSTTNTGTVTLTTTQPNDVIILSYFHNGGAGARTISTVTSAHLTWAKRSQHGWGGGPSDNEIWWATASSPLASEVITITLAGGNIDDAAYHAFGVSGCPNPSSPWDTNASLAAAFASVNTSVPLTLTVSGVTTDSSVPMLIGNTGTFNNALITVPSGTTAVRAEQINSGGILFARTSTFYQNYSSAISSASFTSTQPAGGGFSWGMTIDALA